MSDQPTEATVNQYEGRLPTEVSVDQQAAAAGRVRVAVDPDNEVTQLENHCKAFIEQANLSSHARMMALPKLTEMCFWIRAGMGKGSNP